jgi:hypothetical protein
MLRSFPKLAAASLCAYEVGAITTGKVPTITNLCGRHRWLAPALVVALAVHLARAEQPAVTLSISN